jgi:protein translocase SecG subunit
MDAISVLQIIVSVLLIISILMQSRGAGLSSAFGGDMGGFHTKRGFEKFLLQFSTGLSFLFIVLAILNVLY